MKANPKNKSLVLITVDCLRADHCGFHGYPRPTTPFLDTLAGESIVFSKAVVAGAPTYYSLPGILASRMPLSLGRDVVGLAPGEGTIASVLREAGYATAAFSAANPYISYRFGYHQGFEVFKDFLDFDSASSGDDRGDAPLLPNNGMRGRINRSLKRAAHVARLGSLYDELYFQYRLRVAAPQVDGMDLLRRFPSADVIVDRTLAWIESIGERPFFLWLHLMDPHSPYYPSPEAYRELAGREIAPGEARYLNEFWNRGDLGEARLARKKDAIIELYDAGIRAADLEIARLVSHLQRMNRWDDCLLALTADHGEEFLDHGRRYHAPIDLHEEITRVPLMIRVPGFAGKRAEDVFSQLHLVPTLLDILEVPPSPDFQGASAWRDLLADESRQDGLRPDDLSEPCVITECIYNCTNPLRKKDRMGPRLLSVRNGKHKMVMRMEPGAIESLYDLQADPGERQPFRAGERKEIRAPLLKAARGHLQKNSDAARTEFRLRARLRGLRAQLKSKSAGECS